MNLKRPIVHQVISILEKVPLLQILIGPRQVGKTTAALQLVKTLQWPSVVASADGALQRGSEWIEAQWHLAKQKEERVESVFS